MTQTLIRDDSDAIILGDDIVEVKIDSNRKMYARNVKTNGEFKHIEVMTPPNEGWNSTNKKIFLMKLHEALRNKMLNIVKEKESNDKDDLQIDIEGDDVSEDKM